MVNDSIDLSFLHYVAGRKERAAARLREGALYAYAGDRRIRETLGKLRPVTLAAEAAQRHFAGPGRERLLASAVPAQGGFAAVGAAAQAAAQALGMNKVVSEDALRRALARIDNASSTAWMRPALMHSVREALDRPWVLDIDASIKPLYGRQEGAEIGYNPSKPMRPSHVLHTFLVGNLRLVLDVQVSSGKQHSSGHAKAALGRLLDELGDKRPALVRGDSGYGNEGVLLELEGRGQPYLLRLRQTKNVQRLVARQFARADWSRPDRQGSHCRRQRPPSPDDL